MIERTGFGTTADGRETSVYTLRAGGVVAHVSDFGATLVGVDVPDREGAVADVLLGYDSVVCYAADNPAFFGGTVGPVANRTDRAEVPLNGTVYHLLGNDGPDQRNNNHTDSARGLHKRLWRAEALEDKNAVRLRCELADGELGLPGNRSFVATYSLAEKNGGAELRIVYSCASDATTYANMTNHSYFNLAGHGSGDVLDQVVSIDADAFLPVREDSVPEGELRAVAGTPYDFRTPRAIGEQIDADDEQTRRARGYDQCFCIRGYEAGGEPRHALRAEDPASGRALDVLVSTPGMHLYTGNWLDETCAKDGVSYGPRAGFACEAELYPDNIHHPEWKQGVFGPEEPYEITIVYRFSTC